MNHRYVRSLRAAARLVAGWIAIALLLEWALRPSGEPPQTAIAVAFGVGIGLLSAWFEFWAMERRGRRLSSGGAVIARTLFYAFAATVGTLFFIGLEGRAALDVTWAEIYRTPEVSAYLTSRAFLLSTALVIGASFAINFAHQVRLMLGPGTLLALLVGRYRVPVEEERAFLFLDLTDSTGLAQRLGPERFNAFKNDFFRDVAQPILATGGQIYQYVGDEVVITWRVKGGKLRRSPVETFVLIDRAIARRASRYRSRYGEVPRFKGGLHCGTVVTAEVGTLKKDIVHSGDAVNVTARIEGQCRAYDARLLASDAVLELAPLPEGVTARPIGSVELRGRDGAIPLLRVDVDLAGEWAKAVRAAEQSA